MGKNPLSEGDVKLYIMSLGLPAASPPTRENHHDKISSGKSGKKGEKELMTLYELCIQLSLNPSPFSFWIGKSISMLD